jgi:hypothetical protein
MIYKWENFKLEINEKNSWKLFQFDFTGVSNKTEIISTPAGKSAMGARARQRPGKVAGMTGGDHLCKCSTVIPWKYCVGHGTCLVNAKHLQLFAEETETL